MAKSNFTNIKGDASIIAAAGLEAKSNVQADIGDTVSGFVDSYGELMQAFSDNAEKQTEFLMGTYGDIKKTLPKLKDELEKLEGQGVGADFEAEIQGLRDELAAIPIGFKNKGKRQELLSKINKRIAGVKKEGEKVNSIIEKFDSNLIDPNMGDQELYSLIQNAVKYTAGEKADDSFKISSEDGQTYFSMTINGNEVKKSISEVNDQLDDSIPDASAIIDANKIYASAEDAGKSHANNPKLTFQDIYNDIQGSFLDLFNDHTKPKAYNSIINHRLNGQQRSLVKDLKTEGSDISKNIYEALEKLYPGADTDSKKGISAKEAQAFLNVNNYQAFVDEIKNPSAENKQKIYKIVATALADSEAKRAYDYGVNLEFKQEEKKTTPTSTETDKYGGFLYGRNETSGDPNHPDPNKRAGYQNIGYLKQMQNRNTLLTFDPNDSSTSQIPGLHYDYNYDKDKGWQAFNDGEFVKNLTGSQIARIEGLLSANDIKQGNSYAMFNVDKVLKDQKTKKENERLAPEVPGTVGLGAIEVVGKTANAQHQEIKKNLLNIFNNQFKEEFDILPVYTYGTAVGGFGGSTTSVARDKIRIKSKDGSFNKEYNVGVKATSETASQITQDLNDYITPIDPNLIIK